MTAKKRLTRIELVRNDRGDLFTLKVPKLIVEWFRDEGVQLQNGQRVTVTIEVD